MRLVVHASRHGRHWRLLQEVALEWVDLQGGERAILSLQLPEAALIVFDPVTHTAQFLEVRGEEVSERQKLSMIFNIQVPVDTVALRPGPLA
jgi:hypothetical protein